MVSLENVEIVIIKPYIPKFCEQRWSFGINAIVIFNASNFIVQHL